MFPSQAYFLENDFGMRALCSKTLEISGYLLWVYSIIFSVEMLRQPGLRKYCAVYLLRTNISAGYRAISLHVITPPSPHSLPSPLLKWLYTCCRNKFGQVCMKKKMFVEKNKVPHELVGWTGWFFFCTQAPTVWLWLVQTITWHDCAVLQKSFSFLPPVCCLCSHLFSALNRVKGLLNPQFPCAVCRFHYSRRCCSQCFGCLYFPELQLRL